ncbi:MAG: hypothetical protein QGD92_08295, partial [Gammaproteobacteria bacterium]|nr:hypothetical protein [Gammaproteobacteria bacterium]
MKQFNPDEMRVENSVLDTIKVKEFNREYGAYIGLDVHKDNISIGVALPGRCAGNYRGEMANKPK